MKNTSQRFCLGIEVCSKSSPQDACFPILSIHFSTTGSSTHLQSAVLYSKLDQLYFKHSPPPKNRRWVVSHSYRKHVFVVLWRYILPEPWAQCLKQPEYLIKCVKTVHISYCYAPLPYHWLLLIRDENISGVNMSLHMASGIMYYLLSNYSAPLLHSNIRF